jgi:hypothetical protein
VVVRSPGDVHALHHRARRPASEPLK